MPLLGLEFETLALSAEQMRLLTRVDLELWLVRQSNPAAQRLTGRIATDWNEQDIRELVRDALLDFSGAAAPVGPPSNADPLGNQNTEVTGWERAVQIVQILGKIIAAKKAAEHSSPPSTGNVSTQRYYINPFRGDVVTAQARVRVWRRQLGAAIKKAGPEESPSRGLVLLSAALYGGIFDTDLMVAVARALGGTPGTLGLANQHLYLQISVAWRKMQDLTRRTWYPDPLTATLIARMPPAQPEGVEEGKDLRYNKLLWQEMIGVLRSAGIDRTDEPKSLATFFSDLRVVSQLEMPSLLAAYAAHDIRSQGLPARTLKRIYSVRPAQPISADTSKQAKNRQQPEDKKVLDSLADNPPNEESEWRIQLRKVLVQENRGDALKVLHKLQRDEFLDESARCLIFGFTSHLLSPENGGKLMQMTTVRLWVRTVIRYIGDVLQETEADLIVLSRVSSEILEDIYREAIEEIDPEDETSSVRKRLAHVLRAFHDFLVRKHRVKPLEDSSLLSVHRLGTPVDANLITVEEYHKILDWLDRNWPPTLDPGLRPLARMMVILGFRCGLRRSEALGISCHAVCGLGPNPELLIQPSFGHRLKSDSSKRRLPLLLLPEQERRHFLRLVTQGKSEQYISTPALLTIAGSYGQEVSARRLLPIIHEAMRAVTKDPSLRFHHLRHSFATWTLMRLMIGESGIYPKHFEHLPETQSWLGQSREFCTQIYDVLPSTTRMHAYLVAQMMGHSHPSVTLRYYVHGMDWLLDSYLRAIPEFQPNSRTVALASGLAERTAYNITKQGVAIGPAKRIVNDCATIKGTAAIPARLLKMNWPEMSTATSPDPETSSLWPWRAWDLLYRHLCLGDELSQIAGDCGFSPDQAIGFLQRSTYLCQMHARVGRKGERRGWQHGMVLGSPGGVGRGARISCPIRVSIKTDIAVVTRFAPALTRLMDGAHEFTSVLRYYVDNIWQDWNQLFFRDPGRPNDAKAYLKLLEEIGVKRSQLRFSVLHKLEHCEQLELWKEVLKLPKNISIVRLTPPNAKSHSYDSWIGIEPSLSKSKPAPGNNGTGTYGFRFLMLMGHIVHGATDTEQVCIDLIDELDQAPDSPLQDRIRPGKYRSSSRDHNTRLATRLYNPEAKGYLNHPREAGTNPGRRPGKKTKCVGADELLPIIQRLLRPGGLLCEKTYVEQKRLLIEYLHAGSETFPEKWRNSRGSTCRLLQISGISELIRLMPLVMKFCDSHTNSAYTLETFKRELRLIAAVNFCETTSWG